MNYFILVLLIGFLIVVGAVLIGLMIRYQRRGGPLAQTNYLAIYRLGIILAPVGVVLTILYVLLIGVQFIAIGISPIALGVIYIIIGLQNKDKWNK